MTLIPACGCDDIITRITIYVASDINYHTKQTCRVIAAFRDNGSTFANMSTQVKSQSKAYS